jgi:hypothetical protein
MSPPGVERRLTPKKANIADETAEAVKVATMRTPRLWVWIILGLLSWLVVIAAGWAVYANWIAPAAITG